MRYSHTATTRDGGTASCDKVQQVFRMRRGKCQTLLNWIACQGWMEYTHWTSFKMGSYRNQFSIVADGEGHSWWLGVGLNEGGQPLEKVKVEFNPNKVWPAPSLLQTLMQLHAGSKSATVKQWDFAVDWPAPREDFTMVKDARLYEETMHSRTDRTQYVGQRNAPGRCKLYNKALEQGLDRPLTRVEVTVSGDATVGQVAAWWPRVFRVGDVQTDTATAAINDTDRFILGVLLEMPDKIRELGRRKREKMEVLLSAMRCVVEFDRDAYNDVARFVRTLLDAETVSAAGSMKKSYRWDFSKNNDDDLTKTGL